MVYTTGGHSMEEQSPTRGSWCTAREGAGSVTQVVEDGGESRSDTWGSQDDGCYREEEEGEEKEEGPAPLRAQRRQDAREDRGTPKLRDSEAT